MQQYSTRCAKNILPVVRIWKLKYSASCSNLKNILPAVRKNSFSSGGLWIKFFLEISRDTYLIILVLITSIKDNKNDSMNNNRRVGRTFFNFHFFSRQNGKGKFLYINSILCWQLNFPPSPSVCRERERDIKVLSKFSSCHRHKWQSLKKEFRKVERKTLQFREKKLEEWELHICRRRNIGP